MAIYKSDDPHYIKIPEFGVNEYGKRIWTVKVKKDGIWTNKKFYSYEEAYKYYVDQLTILRNYLQKQR